MFYFPALILDLRALVCELTRERYIYFVSPRHFDSGKKFLSVWKYSADVNNARRALSRIDWKNFPFSYLDLKSTSWDRERGDGRKYPARLLIFENTAYLKSIMHRVDDGKIKEKDKKIDPSWKRRQKNKQ